MSFVKELEYYIQII